MERRGRKSSVALRASIRKHFNARTRGGSEMVTIIVLVVVVLALLGYFGHGRIF